MKQAAKGKQRSVDWPAVLLAVAVSGAVIGGSIGLVRYRNRHRGATQAVFWAVADLAAAPDTLVARVVPPAAYHAALAEFRTALEEGNLPVDAICSFYHEYTLWSRDGVLDIHEITSCLPYLGLLSARPLRQVPVVPDSSEAIPRGR